MKGPTMRQSLLQRLIEKGRVLSKANETKLRSAVSALQEVLSAVASGMPMNEAQHAQFLDASTQLLEAELSYDQRRQTVNNALRAAKTAGILGHNGGYCYIQEMYDTWLVYECYDSMGDGDTLYKVSYAIDEATGAVTFGTPIAVIGRMVYEPVATGAGMLESAATGDPVVRLMETDVVPLLEAAGKGSSVPIKVIGPGWGSSGYYGADVLERDGPTVFTKGCHMYLNHPTLSETVERPERDVRDLAAVLTTDARWDANGTAGPGLYATADVQETYAATIDDLAPHIGVSINTSGRVRMGEADGQSGPIVEALMADPLTSIDFVTRAGAGGQILQLFEAARDRVRSSRSATPQEDTQMALTPQEEQALRESLTRLETDNARLRETALIGMARDLATRQIGGRTDLLEATKTRLIAGQVGRIDTLPLKDGALDTAAFTVRIDEAIAAELAYLQSITGAGEIRGMGGSGLGSGAPDVAALEAQLAEAFTGLGLSADQTKRAVAGRT